MASSARVVGALAFGLLLVACARGGTEHGAQTPGPSSSGVTGPALATPQPASAARESASPASAPPSELPPPRYRERLISIAVEPETSRTCVKVDTDFDALELWNACAVQDTTGVALHLETGADDAEQFSLVKGTRSVFLELMFKYRVYRPGERVLIQAKSIALRLPLPGAPGSYQLRINDTCLPFTVAATAPKTPKRTCWNDHAISTIDR